MSNKEDEDADLKYLESKKEERKKKGRKEKRKEKKEKKGRKEKRKEKKEKKGRKEKRKEQEKEKKKKKKKRKHTDEDPTEKCDKDHTRSKFDVDSRRKRQKEGTKSNKPEFSRTFYSKPEQWIIRTPPGRRVLGEGTQGVVHLGELENKSGYETVAIKSMQIQAKNNRIIRNSKNNRIIEEEKIARRFIKGFIPPHPNIIQFYHTFQGRTGESGELESNIVMEFAKDRNLREFIVGCGYFFRGFIGGIPQSIGGTKTVPESTAKLYIRQIVSGVSFLHEQGLVHHDLKPENIVVTVLGGDFKPENITLKIMDFGLCISEAKLKRYNENRIRIVAGTELYMSPDIENLHAKVDKSLDWYSVGAIMHEMLTGFPPKYVLSPTLSERSKAYLEKRFREKRCHISPEGLDFLQRLTTANAKDRLTEQEIRDHSWIATPWIEGHQNPSTSPSSQQWSATPPRPRSSEQWSATPPRRCPSSPSPPRREKKRKKCEKKDRQQRQNKKQKV